MENQLDLVNSICVGLKSGFSVCDFVPASKITHQILNWDEQRSAQAVRPTEDAIETMVSRLDDATGFLGLSQKSVGKSDEPAHPMSSKPPVVKETNSS